ncbi:MAG: multiheme c-type cytochrome [Gammaproteobacteria bacterium]
MSRFFQTMARLAAVTGLLLATSTGSLLHAATEDLGPGEVLQDERRFPPSYVSTDGHKDVKPGDWTDPRICGQCHTKQYEGWNGSMHSNAFKDPVFQALWALAEKADPNMRNHVAPATRRSALPRIPSSFILTRDCMASSRRRR